MVHALNKIAPPLRRPVPAAANAELSEDIATVEAQALPRGKAAPPKFNQIKEEDRVQFNKRVTRRTADGFELLAIRTRRKVPELLAEALELLEERHGKV